MKFTHTESTEPDVKNITKYSAEESGRDNNVVADFLSAGPGPGC